MHSHFFKSETETSKTRSLCTKAGPRLGPVAMFSSQAGGGMLAPVQGWYNCVSAQRGAECCLNINKLSHGRETPALVTIVTTLTRNTSPPAAAGGSFDQHFQFSSTSFCWTQTLPFEQGVFQPPSRTASSPAKLNHFTL